MRLKTTSDFGVERTSEYGSASELGEALLSRLLDVARHAIADARVRSDGGLVFWFVVAYDLAP